MNAARRELIVKVLEESRLLQEAKAKVDALVQEPSPGKICGNTDTLASTSVTAGPSDETAWIEELLSSVGASTLLPSEELQVKQQQHQVGLFGDFDFDFTDIVTTGVIGLRPPILRLDPSFAKDIGSSGFETGPPSQPILPSASVQNYGQRPFGEQGKKETSQHTLPSPPTRPIQPFTLPQINLSKSSTSRSFECNRCLELLGMLIYYGSEKELKQSTVGEFLCRNCKPLLGESFCDDDDSAPVSRKRRLKKMGKDTIVICHACRRKIATGGVKVAPPGAVLKNAMPAVEWEEPLCGIEHLCLDCVRNFDFCSQCSGGNSFRCGKWRPRQLFQHGRKTCNLPHYRNPNAKKIRTTIIGCPTERIEDNEGRVVGTMFDPFPEILCGEDLKALPGTSQENIETLRAFRNKLMHRYSFLSLAAWGTAFNMAKYSDLQGTWDQLLKRVDIGTAYFNNFLVGGFPDDVPTEDRMVAHTNSRRYLIVLENDTPPSEKQKGKREEPDPMVYLTLEWKIAAKCVHAHFRFFKYGESDHYKSLVRAAFKRILKDSLCMSCEMPLHLVISYRNGDLEDPTLRRQLNNDGYQFLADYAATLNMDPLQLFETLKSVNLPLDQTKFTMVVLPMSRLFQLHKIQ
ncbi:hypothetical protein HDU97_000332 [Phlyctochytrium planicorne]|nr:hypothetical protein HDU97_000332 [Phlyctochytrium planicorne]